MSDDDARVDVNGTGDEAQESFDELTEDLDGSEMVMLYGITAFGISIGSIVLFTLFNNDNPNIAGFSPSVKTNMSSWWGPAWAWFLLSFFDNEVTRGIFSLAVMWSFTGPFVFQWCDLITYILAWQAAGNLMDGWSLIWVAIHSAWNIFGMLWITLITPSIYEWIENADYSNNESDESLSEKVEDEEEAEDDGY